MKNLKGLFFLVAFALAGCSALSGLTGSTATTPSNPTGAPITTDKLNVSLPDFATVAANCAGGDTNSCVQKTNYLAFCKETAGNQESLTACTAKHWTEAVAAGAQ
jgi:hypothetical protein